MKTQSNKTFKKIMIDDLKAQKKNSIVLKIKSIKYKSFSGGDSVTVTIVNPTKSERDFMETFVDEYQHGSFDSMTDMYNYADSNKERSAKYTHLSVIYTDEAKNQAIEELKNKYGVIDDQTAKESLNRWYDAAIYWVLTETESFKFEVV